MSELWQTDNLAALQRRIMRAQSHARPVGGLFGIRKGIAILDQRRSELVGQMRVTAAVTAALRETQVGLL